MGLCCRALTAACKSAYRCLQALFAALHGPQGCRLQAMAEPFSCQSAGVPAGFTSRTCLCSCQQLLLAALHPPRVTFCWSSPPSLDVVTESLLRPTHLPTCRLSLLVTPQMTVCSRLTDAACSPASDSALLAAGAKSPLQACRFPVCTYLQSGVGVSTFPQVSFPHRHPPCRCPCWCQPSTWAWQRCRPGC